MAEVARTDVGLDSVQACGSGQAIALPDNALIVPQVLLSIVSRLLSRGNDAVDLHLQIAGRC